MPRDYDEVEVSPDGWLRVEWRFSSGRMSHEVRTPTLVDTRSGEVLLALGQTWDASLAWGGPGVVTLDVRDYLFNGRSTLRVTLDAGRREARFDGGEPVPLRRGFSAEVEARFAEKGEREYAALAAQRPRPPGWPRSRAREVVVVFVATGALLAVVVGVVLYLARDRL